MSASWLDLLLQQDDISSKLVYDLGQYILANADTSFLIKSCSVSYNKAPFRIKLKDKHGVGKIIVKSNLTNY